MASNGPPKPQRAGLSLYANLLDPSSNSSGAPGTISKAPVLFNKTGGDQSQPDEASQKQQLSAASLRFQPTKRPQLATQKPKPKPNAQKSASQSIGISPAAATPPEGPTVPVAPAKAPVKTSLADWTAENDDDVNGFYGAEKRQRGGRKKRKKNKEDTHIPQNWDDIYDPSRPNSYEEYKNSDEKIAEIREWKDRLYAHRMTRRRSSDSESEGERFRPQMNKQFAPPGMSFAPPASLNETPPPPPVEVHDDPTGEDAYARRMRLSQMARQVERPPSPVQQPFSPPPPPPPPPPTSDIEQARPPPPPLQAPVKAPQASISRAPVRYNLPAAPPELPRSEAELATALETEEADPEAPLTLPGRYVRVKKDLPNASCRNMVEKQKKKPDAEGGGFVGPGGMGKIIGGKKKGGKGDGNEEGKFGAMSEVIVLKGMIDGLDLDEELASGDLMQEIGEECGEKYGRVERVFIDRAFPSAPPVFVKFTSQLSALRAVNALEGRIFNGNIITAKFFDADKFANDIYI
ncbi:mannan polymerase II complex anp1 subunit [Physcia stellaris]|nr:mannan polymerase II complex anp1 subunit [Physcia stellaris]